VLILKGFAVYEEAPAVVEVESAGIPIWGRSRSAVGRSAVGCRAEGLALPAE